jgi:hypothetical protein
VNLSDQELSLYAIREAQLILAHYVTLAHATPRRPSMICFRCSTAMTSWKLSIGLRPRPVCRCPRRASLCLEQRRSPAVGLA